MTDLEKIIAHYGEEAQLNQVTEELGELVTALARWRNDKTKIENLIEEIADVEVVLSELKLILKPHAYFVSDWIEGMKELKITRTLTRIENDNNKSI